MTSKIKSKIYSHFPIFLKRRIYQLLSLQKQGFFSKKQNISLSVNENVLILLPTMDWNDAIQRPHHLARAFAMKGWTVFFLTNNYRYDNVKGIEQIGKNLFLCSGIRLLRGITSPWIYTPWVLNTFFLAFFKGYNLIYDYLDKLEVHMLFNKTSIKIHKQLVREASILIVSSDSLLKDVRNDRNDALLLPNAVFPDDFAIPDNSEIPEDMKSIVDDKKPVIGFYGAFAKWIDFRLVFNVAGHLSGYNFVFIGFDTDDTRLKYNWQSTPNVFFLGKKNYNELPFYAYLFDVAIMPFVVNDMTNAVSPVKLFEFMAMNLPVVSTNIAESRKYKSVRIAEDENSFIQMIKDAVGKKQDPFFLKLVKEDVFQNTWDCRCDQILNRIKEIN